MWEEVCYQYAKHYVDAGIQIGYHEIYNEPDLEILKCWGVFDETFDGFLNWNDFCLGSACAPGNGVYPDMYAYGVRGILRADPYATVGGPAFALGEIGVESWGYNDKAAGEDALIAKYDDMTSAIKSIPAVLGYCYTQLTDVEQEQNGLLDADHKPKVNLERIKAINDK